VSQAPRQWLETFKSVLVTSARDVRRGARVGGALSDRYDKLDFARGLRFAVFPSTLDILARDTRVCRAADENTSATLATEQIIH
jgi:hypothetical protein